MRSFSYKKIIYFSAAAMGIFLAAYLLNIPHNYICVENHQVYQALTDYSEEKKAGLKFIDQKSLAEIPSTFFSRRTNIIASIKINQRLEESENENQTGTISYKIDSAFLVPSVKCDFEKESANLKLTSPELSLTLTSCDKIPQGHRALPVNGLYAADPDYPLQVKTYADCTFFCDSQKALKIQSFLDDFFSSTDGSSDAMVYITSVGDLMLGRGVEDILIKDPADLSQVFTDTLPILQDSDFTIGNLEGTCTASSNPIEKTFTFKFKKEVLPALKAAGFDYLMLTNNHCYDYGEEGFKDTLEAFKEYGIATSGAGGNNHEAQKFYLTNIKGQNFAIISAGAYPVESLGFNGKTMATATENRAGILWKSDQLLNDVKHWSDHGYTVLVNIHAGYEYVTSPDSSQVEFYEALIDHGAKVVYGSHPHVIQPTRWYKDGLIVYSLGNFVFPKMDLFPHATETELVKIGFNNGKIVYVEQFPAKINNTSVGLVK